MKYLHQFTEAEKAAVLRRQQALNDLVTVILELNGITVASCTLAPDLSGVLSNEPPPAKVGPA